MTDIELWAKMLNENYIPEWNDTHLPQHEKTKRHPTGKPKKYWVAVDEFSDLLTNYSCFVAQNLQLTKIGGNKPPTFTTQDPAKAKDLALRAIKKYPKYYVFVGVDDSSHGVMTGKDHLRSSVRYIWNPMFKMWNDAIDESCNEDSEHKKLEESLNIDEILSRALTHLLYYAYGDGDRIERDQEWKNDVITCLEELLHAKKFELNDDKEKKMFNELIGIEEN